MNKSIIYALIVIIIFSIILFSIQNNMFVSTQGSLNAWFATNLSVALSNSLYGLDGGLGYNSIREAIIQHGTIDNNILNKLLDIDNVGSSGFHSSAEIDHGFSYFARLAFYLFGYSFSSLFYTYFLIFIGSIILYLIEFRSKNEALVLLVLILLAYYSSILLLVHPSLGDAGGTLLAYRFITILAIIPIVHIVLKSMIYYENIRKDIYFSNIALLMQSIIICSIYLIRSSSAWIFILALFIFCFNIFFRKKDIKKSIFNFKSILKKLFFTKNTPILILGATLVCFGLLNKASLTSGHELRTEGRHIFWHSIFIGHANNPEIKKHYTGYDLDSLEILTLKRGTKDGVVKSDLISYMCSEDKLLVNKNIRYVPVSRQWLCERQEILKYLLEIRQKYFFDGSKDQNGYSAVFKYLGDNKQNVQKMFNFNPEDNVNYKKQFEWFGYASEEELIDLESIEQDQVDFNWASHYNWIEHEIILKKVVLDAVKNYPIEMIVNMAFFRPIQFSFFYLKNYYLSTGLLNLLFVFGVLLWLSLSVKSKCNDKLKLLRLPLVTIFIFSMIPMIAIYPGAYLIADQSVILSTIIYLLILNAMVRIRYKINE